MKKYKVTVMLSGGNSREIRLEANTVVSDKGSLLFLGYSDDVLYCFPVKRTYYEVLNSKPKEDYVSQV